MSWTGSTRDELGSGCAVHHGPSAAWTTRVFPPATPVHESSPAGEQQREGTTGSSARASPELGRQCADRATVGETTEEEELGDSGARATREGKECSGEVR
jgi:hypothetical protein